MKYAIKILKEELARLNDKEPRLFTVSELRLMDLQITELQSAIAVLEREGEK